MATRLPGWLRQHLAALRILLVLTVLLGLAYPLVVAGVAQIPGLKSRADGSLVTDANGDVGSSLIGQAFTTRTATRSGSTSSPGRPRPATGTTRPRPRRRTSARRASSTSSTTRRPRTSTRASRAC